ncbi:MAG: hypothetical protein V4617_09780 [Gemmatimonadota bacterium]
MSRLARPAGFAVTLLATGGVGCGNGRSGDATADGGSDAQRPALILRSPVTAGDSAMVREAEGALRSWLDASLLAGSVETSHGDSSPGDTSSGERSPGGTSPEASTTPHSTPMGNECDDSGPTFPSPLLADYDVMESALRGDTVVARATVTTVAEQDIDRRTQDRFIARQRVRSDLLEWDVIPTDAGWMVCNGIRFGYRGADSLTRWTPEGASINTARLLADSVRKSRPTGARHPTS